MFRGIRFLIVVTGAAGRLGSMVVRRLIDEGYSVTATDRVSLEDSITEFVRIDLEDASAVGRIFKDAESIIHMGAIPGPNRQSPREIFDNNVRSTFNVLMAAEEFNVRRVVFSSSAFGMGWAHNPSAFVPLYLPLDEDHPMMPFEPYGLSKQIGESIASMVARRSSTSIASLRFTNVVWPEGLAEFPWPAPTPENPLTLVMWAYADPGDVVDAHLLALEADFSDHESFMLAQSTTRFEESTADLVRLNFGTEIEIRTGLTGNSSVISSEKARRVLGWDPRSDWSKTSVLGT